MELEVSLSPASVSAAREELESYVRSLEAGLSSAVAEIGELGADAARASAPVDTGALSLSIASEMTSRTECEVSAESVDPNGHSYAAFAEFGTGVAGAAAGYPGDLSGWAYDTVSTPLAHDGDGWWYIHPDGSKRFTRGYAGRHYMADAAAVMRQRASETVRRSIGG